MRLTARPLTVFNNANSFSLGNQWVVRAGDSNTLYFQIADLDQGPTNTIAGLPFAGAALASNTGMRYIVGLGLSAGQFGINVTFPSIDQSKTVTIAATLVTADQSLWSIVIPSTVQPSGGNVLFQVTEGASVRSFSVLNMLAVEFPFSNGGN